MTGLQLVGCLLVLGLAGFAHGLFGIGFAIVATPLLATFLDYRIAAFMVAAPLLAMAAGWLFVKRSALRSAAVPLSLLPGIAVGAVVGTGLQAALPQRLSLLLLAALLTFSIAMPWVLDRWRAVDGQRARSCAAWFGAAAGMTESALNVGAPFMVLYGALSRLGRVEQLLALNLCFALGKLIQIALMARLPMDGLDARAVLAGTAVSLAGYWQGDRLAGRFSEAAFRAGLRGFLAMMVLALLARALCAGG